MAWATEYNNPNNINVPYPGIIEDGRLFTNYSPSTVINEEIRKKNYLKTDRDYRSYLQNNATKIMHYNFKQSGIDLGRNVPYTFDGVQDTSMPIGYENSSPKNMYLTREQLASNLTRPMRSSYS